MEFLRKNKLRIKVKERRKKLGNEEECSMNEMIFKKISQLPFWISSPAVYLYIDCRHEAGTRKLIEFFWKQKIRVAVPRVVLKDLEFYYISSFEDLEPGSMGIMEPKKNCEKAEDSKAPVIVPGLAFDAMGFRTGYGGGYYDRFFEKEPEHYRIGIAFDFQVTGNVPREAFDQKVHTLVTPHFVKIEYDMEDKE